MNKIFRVLWSATQQCYVVASELAKGKIKSDSPGTLSTHPAEKALVLSGVAAAIVLMLNPTLAMAADTVIADNVAKTISGQDIVATGNRATVGQKAMGLSAGNGGKIDFSSGSLTTGGTGGVAAMANNGSQITLTDTTIITAGDTAHGMMSQNNSATTADKVSISTSGKMAYGLQTFNGSAALSSSKIQTMGASAVGAWTQGASGDLKLNKTDVSTIGENAHALYAMTGGQMEVNGGNIRTTGHTAAAAYANGPGSTITLSGSSVTTENASSEAVYAKDGGTVNLRNTDVSTSKINSYSLRADGKNSTVNYDSGTINSTGDASAIETYDSSMVNVNHATINNSMRYALNVHGSSTANLSNTTINSKGGGISSYNRGTTNLENVVINATGENGTPAHKVGIYTYSAGSSVTAKNVQLNINGDGMEGMQVAYGARASLDNVDINIKNGLSALQVLDGSTLSGNNVRIINNSQDPSGKLSGLWMGGSEGENKVNLTHSLITMNNADSAGLWFRTDAEDSKSSLTLADSVVSAAQSTVMKVTGSTNANVVTTGSHLTGATLLSAGINNNGTVSNFELTGNDASVFSGDVMVNRATTAKNIINLNDNSVWNGATDSLETLNVSSGSAWNVTRSSAVDNLTLDNGTLDMTAPGSGYSEVTIGKLNSNNGTIDFKTHLMGDNSVTDDLIITGDYSGNSNVVVQNAGGTGAQTLNGIELIRVDGDINGTFAQQGRIVAGAYDYHLVQDGNKWLLRDDVVGAIGGENGAPVIGDGSGKPAPIIGDGTKPVRGAPITRPETGSYAANLAAANTLFITSLADRLGETHYIGADGKKHSTSLWLRNAGGHTRFSDSSGQLKTSGNRYVMQLGGDIAQWSSNGDDRFHLGVMGGYANAQSNTISSVTGYSARGEVHGYSTGVYATWLQDKAEQTGAYVDSWMLYNWFDNSVKGQDIAPESYKSKGITASVEVGYSFKVAELSERSSFYLQPKAQVTWMGVEADDHQERNGTRVVGEGNNNVQTRLGVRAYVKGHNPIDDGKNRTFKPFIEANWIHNTETFGSSLNGVAVKQAGTRDVGEVKVGVDAKLNNTVNLWGNIGQQMGDKGYSDTSAMIGVKVNF